MNPSELTTVVLGQDATTITSTMSPYLLEDIEGGEIRSKLDALGLPIGKVILANTIGDSITVVSRKKLIKAVEKNIEQFKDALVRKYAVYFFHRDINKEELDTYPFKEEDILFDIDFEGVERSGMPSDSIDFYHDESVLTLHNLGIKYEFGYRCFFIELSDEVWNITSELLKDEIQAFLESGVITMETIAKDIKETADILNLKNLP